ncbi:MAG: 2-oxo acid dehydrogenase subunit E2, partial [Deltaproteobacteria bacterium]|nr:2-oxo acid dehydrogenase subunit E2 [Deltaproteobacteria bacterium]
GTGSFFYQAFPQVLNEAANTYYMTGGQTKVPVVFHLLHGIRGGGAAQHSHSPQAMLWNTPGLEIMLPSTPRDVKGLLKTAVRSENPTVFVDHAKLFEVKGEVPEGNYEIPFGQAEVKRRGKDVTVVATSLMVQRALQAAEKLARQGIDVEVVDPRTLVPFDKSAVLESVAKTGRLVVADECHKSCGVAAEIAAIVAEEGFQLLKAPIRRVAIPDVPIPFGRSMEAYIEPSEEKIVEEGTVVRWIKAEGDEVREGEAVLEIETEKATVEIEAPASGILTSVAIQEGETVAVGTRLGVIASPGEEIAALGHPKAFAEEGKVATREMIEPPVHKAEERTALGAKTSGVSSMRRIIGERMSESKRAIPHFYVNMEVDMTEAVKLREEWKERKKSAAPSFNDFVLWGCAQALKKFPLVNSTMTETGVQLSSEIHLGMAVAVEEGLVVPVIRNADRLDLSEVAQKSRELVEKVQQKKLIPADYEGGTFTVSNLGMFGVESFSAIINPPQCAILAVGRVAPRVVPRNGNVAVRSVMAMTLSADHRIVDGVIAARFLQAIKELLERPEL